jgi:hypothetical protein
MVVLLVENLALAQTEMILSTKLHELFKKQMKERFVNDIDANQFSESVVAVSTMTGKIPALTYRYQGFDTKPWITNPRQAFCYDKIGIARLSTPFAVCLF